MIISGFIIRNHPLLYAFAGNINGNVDFPILRAVRGKNPKLDGGKGCSCISVTHICQKLQGVLIHHRIVGAESLFLIGNRSKKEYLDILFGKLFQFKNNRAG